MVRRFWIEAGSRYQILLTAISGCYSAKPPKIVITHAILKGCSYIDPPFRDNMAKLDSN
jgi:hypothetical protein